MLPEKADSLIFDTDNIVFVSSVSLWEIAIKTSLAKLELNAELSELESICERSNLIVLSFQAAHALEVANLPHHHKDPFDRALIAQAQLEQMNFITHDRALAAYGPSVILV